MLQLNFTSFPYLQTERLQLRPLSLHDVPEIFLLRSSDEVNQYLGRAKATSFDDARDFINRIIDNMEQQKGFFWAISFKDTNLLLGTVCYWNMSNKAATGEVGYELLPHFQGQGIMQEALKVVFDFGFNKIEFKSIEACVIPANQPSINAIKKFGFKKVADNVDGGSEAMYALNGKDFD